MLRSAPCSTRSSARSVSSVTAGSPEIGRKYALTVEVSLLSVLRLYLPRLVIPGTLADKRDSAPLALVWGPVEQTGEPLRCQRCRDLTYEAGLHRTGIVTCPRCVGVPIKPSRAH